MALFLEGTNYVIMGVCGHPVYSNMEILAIHQISHGYFAYYKSLFLITWKLIFISGRSQIEHLILLLECHSLLNKCEKVTSKVALFR